MVKTDAKTDARGLGKEEAVDVVHGVHFPFHFLPPLLFPDHVPSIFAWPVFETSLLSESLAQVNHFKATFAKICPLSLLTKTKLSKIGAINVV